MDLVKLHLLKNSEKQTMQRKEGKSTIYAIERVLKCQAMTLLNDKHEWLSRVLSPVTRAAPAPCHSSDALCVVSHFFPSVTC